MQFSVYRVLYHCCVPTEKMLIKLEMKSGPGCSKLTTSLVNVSLKFQTLKVGSCPNDENFVQLFFFWSFSV